MRDHAIILVALALTATACQSTSPSETTTATAPSTSGVAPSASGSTIASTTTVSETTTTTTAFAPRFSTDGLFAFDSPSLAIPNGPDGAWDFQYTDPGAVYTDADGVVHVFQNGFVGWPAPVGVGYWRSKDGMSFAEISEAPVFDGTDLPYVGVAALASSAIVESDGTWVLYFYSWDAGTWPFSPSSIGRATAPEPTGPWTADAEPVLTAGGENDWDSLFVRTPSVLVTDDGYVMYYAGGSKETASIGMATSPDGITWAKHDDPETTEPELANSDPILVPGSVSEGNVWDQRAVYQPRVVEVDGVRIMSYASSNTVSNPLTIVRKIGMAVSSDGVEWTRSKVNVVSTGALQSEAFWFTALTERHGELLLFVESQRKGETDVHLARAQVADVLDAVNEATR